MLVGDEGGKKEALPAPLLYEAIVFVGVTPLDCGKALVFVAPGDANKSFEPNVEPGENTFALVEPATGAENPPADMPVPGNGLPLVGVLGANKLPETGPDEGNKLVLLLLF